MPEDDLQVSDGKDGKVNELISPDMVLVKANGRI